MPSETNSNKCKCKNPLKDGYDKAPGITILIPYSRYLLYWICVNTNLKLMKLNFAVNMKSLNNHVCCDLISLYRDLRSYLGGRTLSDLYNTDPLPQSTTDQGVQVWPQGLDNVPTIVYIFIFYTQLFYFSLGNVLDSEKSHGIGKVYVC